MQPTIEETFIEALLADAVYVNGLTRGQSGLNLADALSDRMTSPLAQFIGANFTVADVAAGFSSGFEAVVWRGNSNTPYSGKIFVSIRGTQEGADFLADADLASSGLAHQQLADMVSWWLRETSLASYPDGDPVFVRQLSVTQDNNFILGNLTQGTGVLADIGSITSVNGHSLGGYLATSFARTFGAKWSIEAVNTFNSAGFSRAATANIEQGFSQIASAIGHQFGVDSFSIPQNNYFALNGVNVTTNTWDPVGFQQYGSRIGLFQEDLAPMGINNHYMYKLTDLLSLGDALVKLDSSLTLEKLSVLIRAGSDHMAASYEGVLDAIRRIVFGPNSTPTQVGDANGTGFGQPPERIDYHVNIDALVRSEAFRDLSGLLSMTVATADLRAQARNDFSAVVALQDLSPVVISGKNAVADARLAGMWQATRSAEFTAWAADKSAPTPVAFTDQWIADRASMLGALVAKYEQDLADGTPVGGTANVTYIDVTTSVSVLVRAGGFSTGVASGKILFGSSRADTLVGGSQQDHLYGGDGNDLFSASLANDYVEGNAGNDTLDGGAGSDTLRGGPGTDTYAFSGPWGKDTVIDSDGSGALTLDGSSLGGGNATTLPNTWLGRTAAGRMVQYSFNDAGQQLVIAPQGDSANSITVKNFDLAAARSASGYLGIKLTNTADMSLMAGNVSTPYSGWDFKSASLAIAATLAEKAGQTFKLFLNQALHAGETIRLEAVRGTAGLIKLIDGANTYDLSNPVTLMLSEGQSEIAFAIVSDAAIDADQELELQATWTRTDGVTSSNLLTVNLQNTTDPTNTLTGDFTKKIVHDKYIFLPDQPADGQYNYAVDEAHPSAPGAADLITGTDQGDKILGLGGNDALLGRDGADSIDGGDGDDILQGGLGADTIAGGAGDDIIYGSSTGWLWTTDTPGRENGSIPAGTTLLSQGFGWYVVTDGTLDVNGQPARSLPFFIGRDEQFADAGNVIDAGAGNDIVHAGVADDRVEAGDGMDIVYGMGGNDLVLGQQGNDYIFGDGQSARANVSVDYTPAAQHGQDFLDGGEGNDTLVGQGNNDVLYGGAGSDQLWGDGGQFMSGDVNYLDPAYSGSDYLDGEEGDDTLLGQGGADTLYGGSGNDMLQGDDNSTARLPGRYNGSDYLDGEDGNDTLLGGGAGDTLFGGAGADLILGDDNTLDAKFHGADYIDAEAGDDTVIGGGDADTIYGGAGNDSLVGDGSGATGTREGDDYIDGEDGNDALVGGGGNDTLFGGAGNDTLYSGSGDDTLSGGDGANVYVIDQSAGTVTINSTSAQDMVKFADGVASGAITGWIDGDVLEIQTSATQKVSVTSGIAGFRFADGTTISAASMAAYLQAHPPAPPPASAPIGSTTTNQNDASGHPTGSTVTVTTPNGSTSTLYAGPDGTGTKQGDTWTTAGGGHGSDTFNSDGSSRGVAYNVDGSYSTYTDSGHGDRAEDSFAVNGFKTGTSWVHADGTRGSDSYSPDGAGSGIAYHSDGTYDTYTDDGRGHVTTLSYDSHGKLLSTLDDGRTYPGTAEVHFTDGSYRVETWTAPGELTSTLYGPDHKKANVSWSKADGTHGTESFFADGSSSAAEFRADGSHDTIARNTTGMATTTSFSAAGAVLGSSVEQAQGLNRITTYRDATGAKVSESWVHPDGATGVDTLTPYVSNGMTNLIERVEASHSDGDNAGWLSGDQAAGSYSFDVGDTFEQYSEGWWLGYDRATGTGHGSAYYIIDQTGIANDWYYTWTALPGSSSDDFYIGMAYEDGRGASEEFFDVSTGVQVDEVLGLDGHRYFGLPGNYQDAGLAASPVNRTFGGNQGFDVLQEDGLGNGVFTRYSTSGVRLGDVWFHNDGSHGSDAYLADGTSWGLSAGPSTHYYEFTKDAQGNTTSLHSYPGTTSQTWIVSPPIALAPSPPPPRGIAPAGGTSHSSDDSYAAPNGITHWKVSPVPGKECDQLIVFLNNQEQVVATAVVHTDPGFELAVPQAGGTAGWKFDPAGIALGRYIDDGQGVVTTWHYGAQQRAAGYDTATTAADGAVTTQEYGVAGVLLGYSVKTQAAEGHTHIDSFDAAGRLVGYTDAVSDGHGNSMSSSYDALGNLTGSQANIVDASGYRTTIRSYDASDASTGAIVTTNFADSASIQTDTYDASGHLVGSVVARHDAAGASETVNFDATGQITSVVKLVFGADGAPMLTTFDASGRELREVSQGIDGVESTTEYGTDGTATTTTVLLDGAYTVKVRAPNGDVVTTSYSAQDAKLADTWTRGEGSHGSDTFASDGSATGNAAYADGTTASFVTDTAGRQTATYRDAGGAITGTAITVELADRSETTHYDTAGNAATQRWWGKDGSWGFTDWTDTKAITGESHSSDGTYAASTDDGHGNAATTNYDAAGVMLSRSWTHVDGSSASESFHAGGARTASFADGLGMVTTTEYDAGGHKVSDTWAAADGSFGSDTFHSDGSYVATIADGHGKTTVTEYSSNGGKQSDTWTAQDGSYGSDFFSADGGFSGESHFSDGSRGAYDNQASGYGWSHIYDASGNDIEDATHWPGGYSTHYFYTYDTTGFQTGDSYTDNEGGTGFDVYAPDASSHGEQTWADGSWYRYSNTATTSQWTQSDGSHGISTWDDHIRTATSFDLDGSYSIGTSGWNTDFSVYSYANAFYSANGVKTHGDWGNSQGHGGTDTFNPDGSSSGRDNNTFDGTFTLYVNDGAADVTTTSYSPSGVRAADAWVRADGSHGSTTFNADGTVSGSRIAADGTTFSFDHASNALQAGTAIAGQLVSEMHAWTYTLAADGFRQADAGNMLTYAATLGDGSALPVWLVFNAHTGTFSGTPPAGTAGLQLKVVATAMDGQSAYQAFSLQIANPGLHKVGTSAPDTLVGGSGNDTLTAVGNGDVLIGGPGSDVLNLQGTTDGTVYNGGPGNDTLTGSWGSDTYIFNRGDGQDLIGDMQVVASANSIDVLQLGAGIAPADVALVRSGVDLVFKVGSQGDQVTVLSWFGPASGACQIEKVKFADGSVWTKDQVNARMLDFWATAGNDSIVGVQNFAETLHGAQGNDTLTAVGNKDVLDGGAGDDVLNTQGTTDGTIYIGGPGNDTITGAWGSDTYAFNLGDGQDTILDMQVVASANSIDVLRLGAGIAAVDVALVRSGVDLIFKVGTQGDQVTVLSWFGPASGACQIEKVNFADGTVWTKETINASLLDFWGTAGDDSIVGVQNFAETLHGAQGNDTLTAVGNRDVLDGGAGDDVLNLQGATDGTVYNGGPGNDTITGSWGSDTYVFNRGDGHDTVLDMQVVASANSIDVLRFGADIAAQDVTLVRSGVDLVFKVGGEGDQIDVLSWFGPASGACQIEKVNFADGTVWTRESINAEALNVWGTAGNDYLKGVQAFADTLHGGAGNDTLVAFGGNDVLDGGADNDALYGSSGSDTYLFGRGDGQDRIYEASPGASGAIDVLQFGAGISAEQITFQRVNSDLKVAIVGGLDAVTVSNWYGDAASHIEVFRLADGHVITGP